MSSCSNADTMRSILDLAEGLRLQVEGLPEPVVIVGHSQAVWIIWEALTAGARMPGVEALILIGPLPESPAPFPPHREREPGRIGADLLHIAST
jgi:pimeloyl-ACP methyl ester carboxylesterase